MNVFKSITLDKVKKLFKKIKIMVSYLIWSIICLFPKKKCKSKFCIMHKKCKLTGEENAKSCKE